MDFLFDLLYNYSVFLYSTRSVDREKIVSYHQFFVDKKQLQMRLSYYKMYGLVEDKA